MKRALLFVAAVGLILFPILPRMGVIAVALAGLAIAALGARALGAFLAIVAGAWLLPIGYSQATLAIAVGVHVAIFGAPWLWRGRGGWLAAAAIVVTSSTALVVWLIVVQPDVHDLVQAFLPHWPRALLVLAAIPFAMVNAALEEAAYRGIVQTGLAELGAAPAVVLQAIAFGMLHLHGFPRGASGVVLAACYGTMLGALRRKTSGLLAPWVAHVCADVTIAALLISWG